MKRRLTGSCFVLSMVAGFSSAQEKPPQPRPQLRNTVKVPEGEAVPEALKKRVEAYWQARMDKDLKALYGFFPPEYRRGTSAEQFGKENESLVRAKIVSFEVKNLVYEDEAKKKARVRTIYETEPQIFTGRFQALKEDLWENMDGEWYMIYVPSRLPFTKTPGVQ